jgi:hypothetical protein
VKTSLLLAVCGVVLLALPACGSGTNTTAPPPSEVETVYVELISACRDAEQKIPGLSDWPAVIEEVTYKNDGSAEFFALAAEFAEHNSIDVPPNRSIDLPPAAAEDFIAAMDSRAVEEAFDASLNPNELAKALAVSAGFADRFSRLRAFDSLAVLAPSDGWTLARDMATGRLLDTMRRRPRLLLLAGRPAEAEEEFVAYVEVLQRIDRDSCLRARTIFNAGLAAFLCDLVQGGLQPLAGAKHGLGVLAPLFETGSIGRKRAWLRELKRTCWYVLNTPKENVLAEYQMKVQDLRRIVDCFRYDVSLAQRFEMNAPDVLAAADLTTAFELARRHDESCKTNLAHVAWQEARLQAAWLAYHLYTEHKRESLKGRNDAIAGLTQKFKAVSIRNKYNVLLQVGVDPEFEASKVLGRTGFNQVAAIWLNM